MRSPSHVGSNRLDNSQLVTKPPLSNSRLDGLSRSAAGGRELGPEGINAYTEYKTISVPA